MAASTQETTGWDAPRVAAALDLARHDHWEDPDGAVATAVNCEAVARTLGLDALRARALVVQGLVSLNRGDLRGAFARGADADRLAERADDDAARLEAAGLKSQLSFFSGSYTEALQQAWTTIDIGERIGTRDLRIFARRAACLVLGNLSAPGFIGELHELLRFSIAAGDRWQIAVSRNDIAHYLMDTGDVDGADDELSRGIAIAEDLAPANSVALGTLHCTRAELRMRTDRPVDALVDAEHALELLITHGEPHPYLFAVTTRLQVQALLALGHTDDAQTCGERAVARLGDRVPQARSMILEAVATALREAGRVEDAYDALSRGAELERRTLQELTEMQLGFERATQETKAARHEAAALAQKNRELEQANAELERAHAELAEAHVELAVRNGQLERLEAQLREQALRDPLTGLHNRRHLNAVLAAPLPAPVSIAILDLDHFKRINDDLGHAAGDQVLVRTAALLRAVMRPADTVVRSGGEEFVLVMPETDETAARAVCERLLAALRAESWQRVADGLAVTASAGVASGDDAAALSRVADARLYEAKRGGRDRVVGTV
ncbi:MAG TPA: diguanylate cyclase [Solirubrobacteraceae bacterium]|nr:diguanylate cyclase [Solirubrobacteraceae bacterium]